MHAKFTLYFTYLRTQYIIFPLLRTERALSYAILLTCQIHSVADSLVCHIESLIEAKRTTIGIDPFMHTQRSVDL